MIALLIAGSVAMAVSLFGTRVLIGFFRSRGKGQPILGPEDRGPEHQHKAGTPTMGGLAILASAVVGYLVAHFRRGAYFSDHAMFMMAGIAAMATLGFLDDFLKVRRAHNRGVLWKKKGWITLVMSFLIALLMVSFTKIDTRIGLTRADRPGWELGKAGWVLWAGLIIFSTVNAVNVTDGLDGLAAGSAIFGFFAFTVIAFWGLRNPTLYPYIVNPFDISILAVALGGACVGFLWWNAAPARIIMGDVGALGLGAALGAAGAQHGHQPPPAPDLPAERHRDRLGGAPDGQLQAVQQAAHLPHVADPPPLRARRLAGDDGGHPVLDHRRHRRGDGARSVLRGLRPPDRGGLMKALVYGLAVTGDATVRALEARGWDVTVADDRVRPATRASADELGVELVEAPDEATIAGLLADVDLVSPSPGLAETHRLFEAAERAGVPVRSEIELAYTWEQTRAAGPGRWWR